MNRIGVSAADGKRLLHEITCHVQRGTAIGVTGESGSGKTTLLKATMGVLGKECTLDSGNMILDGCDLAALAAVDRRKVAGKSIGFIPQLPMTAFDSRLRIGSQIQAVFRKRLGLNRLDAAQLAQLKLRQVQLSEVERVMRSRPGELSGGMLQRVALAILFGLNPPYMLADEPTAALDPDNRAAVIQLLLAFKQTSGLLIVSHDVEVLERICDQVHVLYNGEFVEQGTMKQLLDQPRHIWTSQFARSVAQQEKGYWLWEKSKYQS
ncbi:ATP-binding cassette domain-containing protein [Paenibacillus sp. ACRRX]|uniref:ATP-binding cassette domain-containing protein n=1 Tax=Paenibacillus sp. ACRRX TaxID=2918206 RepID=UPI001EF6B98A|nr:ATP-binding cassette domain-containing protein [Paenibacillus sp. ACRRX]MCG7406632.1 ATP-binding cassette domain-containing protein [Paenibacillus sp. ACRRX]